MSYVYDNINMTLPTLAHVIVMILFWACNQPPTDSSSHHHPYDHSPSQQQLSSRNPQETIERAVWRNILLELNQSGFMSPVICDRHSKHLVQSLVLNLLDLSVFFDVVSHCIILSILCGVVIAGSELSCFESCHGKVSPPAALHRGSPWISAWATALCHVHILMSCTDKQTMPRISRK